MDSCRRQRFMKKPSLEEEEKSLEVAPPDAWKGGKEEKVEEGPQESQIHIEDYWDDWDSDDDAADGDANEDDAADGNKEYLKDYEQDACDDDDSDDDDSDDDDSDGDDSDDDAADGDDNENDAADVNEDDKDASNDNEDHNSSNEYDDEDKELMRAIEQMNMSHPLRGNTEETDSLQQKQAEDLKEFEGEKSLEVAPPDAWKGGKEEKVEGGHQESQIHNEDYWDNWDSDDDAADGDANEDDAADGNAEYLEDYEQDACDDDDSDDDDSDDDDSDDDDSDGDDSDDDAADGDDNEDDAADGNEDDKDASNDNEDHNSGNEETDSLQQKQAEDLKEFEQDDYDDIDSDDDENNANADMCNEETAGADDAYNSAADGDDNEDDAADGNEDDKDASDDDEDHDACNEDDDEDHDAGNEDDDEDADAVGAAGAAAGAGADDDGDEYDDNLNMAIEQLMGTQNMFLPPSKNPVQGNHEETDSLQQKQAEDLEEEQAKTSSLRREHKVSVSQQLKQDEELERLTQKNQKLSSENRRLQSVQEEQQMQSVLRAQEIQFLKGLVENLQSEIEHKEKEASSAKDKVQQLSSDLEEEQGKTSSLQRDRKVSVSQQLKQDEELERLTRVSEDLALENKRLHGELNAAHRAIKPTPKKAQEQERCRRSEEEVLKERVADLLKSEKELQLCREQQSHQICELTAELQSNKTTIETLRGDLETSLIQQKQMQSLLKREEAECKEGIRRLQEERAHVTKECNEIDSLQKDLSEQKLALEESLTAERSLKREKKHLEELLSHRRRRDSASSEHLKREVKTLMMEKDKIKSKYQDLSERHEEMLSTSTQHKVANTLLQLTINQLKTNETESDRRLAELKDVLRDERRKKSELRLRLDKTTYDLERESSNSRREYHNELQKALRENKEIQREKQRLADALHKAELTYASSTRSQEELYNMQLRQVRNMELRLSEQDTDLNQSMRKLRQERNENFELVDKNNKLMSDNRKLQNEISELHIRYNRLSITREQRPWSSSLT
ncbi:probable serine/threonine-protein kinase kinX [Notolabrus celidotus]|uniref:probable serine/threonine-protein kinase kinX n=1 Tax=Notolabrus celidotus TaxID=1203425 RepID=UPI00148FE1E9|nr:probable serine/threonine-protein kinase kinX [Notolabrus celidotus]